MPGVTPSLGNSVQSCLSSESRRTSAPCGVEYEPLTPIQAVKSAAPAWERGPLAPGDLTGGRARPTALCRAARAAACRRRCDDREREHAGFQDAQAAGDAQCPNFGARGQERRRSEHVSMGCTQRKEGAHDSDSTQQ